MESRFVTEEQFVADFGKEMASVTSLYEQMKKNGLVAGNLTTFDFTYLSNSKAKLDTLSAFFTDNYGFKMWPVTKDKDDWELTGDATEFPVDEDNLMFWALDLYCKGYEFDCELTGYGAVTDPKSQVAPKLNRKLADQYFDLALKAYNKRNLGMSFAHFSTVLKLDPKDANAWYSRAIIKDQLHTWKSARRDYDEAIKLALKFTDAIINRAANKDEAGEYEEAIKDYDMAIGVNPGSSIAYFNRGNSKHNLGRTKDACQDWEKAKELGESDAQKKMALV